VARTLSGVGRGTAVSRSPAAASLGPPPPSRPRSPWLVPVVVLVVLAIVAGVVVALAVEAARRKAAKGRSSFRRRGLQDATPSAFRSKPAVAECDRRDPVGRLRRLGAQPARRAITVVSGATPGLYGGSNRVSVCDIKQMVSFLAGQSGQAAAWAGVQGNSGLSSSRLPQRADAGGAAR